MKKLLALLIIFLLLLFVARGWWMSQTGTISTDTNIKSIVIAKGSSVDEIANQLQKEGIIKSALTFKLQVKLKGAGDKLQAGVFNLSPSMSTDEIITVLTGIPEEIWVTLIEGWRVEEMAQELAKSFGDNSEEFVTLAKEGYTFPDTYRFPPDVSMEEVAKRLRDRFDEQYSAELKSRIRSKGFSEKEGVILASIVEREARSDEARKIVASILLKRYKIDMGLNADATLQYALGYQPEEKSWWKRHLTKEDKLIDSPYNTYRHVGLPPGPICNPSLSSLQAVANADPNTPYLYYYHDSKGNSHYAETLEEHNENVANNP